jgi:hypothetical protein
MGKHALMKMEPPFTGCVFMIAVPPKRKPIVVGPRPISGLAFLAGLGTIMRGECRLPSFSGHTG